MFVVSFSLPVCSLERVQAQTWSLHDKSRIFLTQFENTFTLCMNYGSNTGPKTLRLKYDNSSFLSPIDGADVTQNPDLSRLLTRKVPLHMSSMSNNTAVFHTAHVFTTLSRKQFACHITRQMKYSVAGYQDPLQNLVISRNGKTCRFFLCKKTSCQLQDSKCSSKRNFHRVCFRCQYFR